jgi:hypothetical protein
MRRGCKGYASHSNASPPRRKHSRDQDLTWENSSAKHITGSENNTVMIEIIKSPDVVRSIHSKSGSCHAFCSPHETTSRHETRVAHCVGRASVCIYEICLSRWISTCSSFWLTLCPQRHYTCLPKKIKRGIVKQCTPVNPAFPQPIN